MFFPGEYRFVPGWKPDKYSYRIFSIDYIFIKTELFDRDSEMSQIISREYSSWDIACYIYFSRTSHIGYDSLWGSLLWETADIGKEYCHSYIKKFIKYAQSNCAA